MLLAYLGNWQPPHSTENHVARAFEANGHQVRRIQEGEVRATEVPAHAAGADLFLWTQTYGLAVTGGTIEERAEMVRRLGEEMPTCGYHLDRWWGLDREDQVAVEPFFRLQTVVTADGGHEDMWAQAGVNHRWLPPAVSRPECEPGRARGSYASDVAFVGSWRGGYHAEWGHRRELVRWLQRTYRNRCRFWPKGPAIRGEELRDLYASTRVVVGDSCLVPRRGGAPITRYLSDRCPETIGRGGFLVHPDVEGVTDGTLYKSGTHLATWPLGDWDALRHQIDYYLRHAEERQAIAAAGREHVLEHHTYEVRVGQLLDLLHPAPVAR